MKIVVAIVTYQRSDALRRCLDTLSLMSARFNFEVKIAINGTDNLSTNVAKTHITHPKIFQILPKNTPAFCRNEILNDGDWDYAFFIDDDAYISSEYVESLAKIFKLKKVPEIFGGPDMAPITSTSFQKAVGIAQQSFLTTAMTRYRHTRIRQDLIEQKGIIAGETKLILCNMWVSRNVWEKVGGFDRRFMRNEENVWLDKASKYTDSIFYFSDLFVYHSKKANIRTLFKAVFNSGFFRIKSALMHESSLSLIYLAPMAFLIYCAGAIVFCLSGMYLIPIYLYIVLNLITSIFYSKKNKHSNLIVQIMIIQLIIVLSYGLGSLWGVFAKDPN